MKERVCIVTVIGTSVNEGVTASAAPFQVLPSPLHARIHAEHSSFQSSRLSLPLCLSALLPFTLCLSFRALPGSLGDHSPPALLPPFFLFYSVLFASFFLLFSFSF